MIQFASIKDAARYKNIEMKDQEMKIIIDMEKVVTNNMVILKVRDCAIQQLLIQFFNMRPITTTIMVNTTGILFLYFQTHLSASQPIKLGFAYSSHK